MDTGRGPGRLWTDDQLVDAVAVERSWRGVCRALGLKGTSAGVLRTVKRHAERLDLDTAHFTHQRTWSDTQLRVAVRSASTWSDVLCELGLTDRGETRVRVKGHAIRLGLDVSHLRGQTAERPHLDLFADVGATPSSLRVAAEAIATAWLTLRGIPVAVPAKSEEYDLLASFTSGIGRIQVKSTTHRSAGKWVVGVGRRPYSKDRASSKIPYDPDSVDYFLLINGAGAIYLIPSGVVAGRTEIQLDSYAEYLVGDASSLLAAAS
jgi:PD-(D/E)XK endonuclease